MNAEVYQSKAGWYIVIHRDFDSKPEVTGPFTTISEADQELKEILACSPIHPSSSHGLQPQS